MSSSNLSLQGNYASKVLSYYLWGQETAASPTDIADEKWLSHDPVTLNIDASEYLQTVSNVPTAADLKLVNLFFKAEQRVGGAIDLQQALNNKDIELELNSQGEYEANHTDFIRIYYKDVDRDVTKSVKDPVID